MTEVSAVTVDVHGVLLLPDPAVLRQMLEPFGAGPDDETCWRAHFEMIRLIDVSAEAVWPEIHGAMAAALGVAPGQQAEAAPTVVETYLTRQWIAAPGAADALVRPESRGLALAVIANSPHGQVAQWLTDAGLCDGSARISSN
jgi:FMN phosphatase YigB (HAD superfamily)